MNKGNVLVIGNSGVGKSTLINAVLGEQVAKTSWGTEGTTKELKIYEKERVPFRIIDTAGFEPSILKEMQAINAVKRWSRESTKEGKEDTAINIIWFCIDGTSRKLFIKTIKDLSSATKIFKTVPVVVVITKSYSVLERSENIEMVQNAFANQKLAKNLKKIIPVVAETYKLNDTAYAAPEGITELIDITNNLMPEGIRAAKRDIGKFKLSRKNALSQGLIASATLGGIAVGAIPIPFADAAILSPVEVGLVNGLASIYEIGKNEKSNNFINSIKENIIKMHKKINSAEKIEDLKNINELSKDLNKIIDSKNIVEGYSNEMENIFKTCFNKEIQKLITDSKLKKLEKQRLEIEQEKCSFFSKLLGKAKLKQAKLDNINLKKQLILSESQYINKSYYYLEDGLSEVYTYLKEETDETCLSDIRLFLRNIEQNSQIKNMINQDKLNNLVKEKMEQKRNLPQLVLSKEKHKLFSKAQINLMEEKNNELKRVIQITRANSLKLQNTGMIPILGNIKTTKSISKFCNNLNEINNTLKYQNQ